MTEDPENLPPGYWLMKLSLEKSGIYNTIVRRLGSALIAQERVSQYNSDRLSNNHWQLEAARLFATSLALIQYEAWSIASGEDSQEEGYIWLTPDEAGNLCGLFKFNSSGYTNLAMWPIIWLILALPGLWILSKEARKVRDAGQMAWGVVIIPLKWLRKCLKGCLPWKTGAARKYRTSANGVEVQTNEESTRDTERSSPVSSGGHHHDTTATGDILDEGTTAWNEGSEEEEREGRELRSEERASHELEDTNSARDKPPLWGAPEDILAFWFIFYVLIILPGRALRRLG